MNRPISTREGLASDGDLQQPARFAMIISVVEEIPLEHDPSESSRAGRMWMRAVVLLIASALACLPCFSAAPLDGEADRLRHMVAPDPPFGTLHQLASWYETGARVPNLLRILIYVQHGPEGASSLFQIDSVALHALSVLLLWFVLRRLSIPAAWLAALLFALHPANAPAVAWVSQQGRLWAAVFALSGTVLLLRNRRVPPSLFAEDPEYLAHTHSTLIAWLKSAFSYSAAMLFFGAAALCQPAAAVVPVVVIMLVAWKKKVMPAEWTLLAPPLLTGIVLTSHWFWKNRTHLIAPIASIHSRWIAALVSIGRVVSDCLLLHSARSPWVDAGTIANWTAGVLGSAVLTSLPILWLLRRRIGTGPMIATLAFVLLLPTTIAPVAVHVSGKSLLGILNSGQGYLCGIPLIVMVASLIVKLTLKVQDHTQQALRQLLAGAVAAIVCGMLSYRVAWSFGDTERLLETALDTNPSSSNARSRLAEYYLDKGSAAGVALAQAELTGVRIDDCQDAGTAIAEGELCQATGQGDAAIAWFQHAEMVDPQSSQAVGHLASLYVQLGRIGEATAAYEQAIQHHPGDPALRNDFGLLYAATGRNDQAIEQFHQAIEVDADYVPAHVNLANALISQHQLSEAASELQRAVALDPDNFEAFHNAGIVLAQLHDYEHAITMLTNAVQLRPDLPQARNDLGVALVAAGKFNRAIFEFNQALSLAPTYDAARHNLDIAQRRLANQKAGMSVQAASQPSGS